MVKTCWLGKPKLLCYEIIFMKTIHVISWKVYVIVVFLCLHVSMLPGHLCRNRHSQRSNGDPLDLFSCIDIIFVVRYVFYAILLFHVYSIISLFLAVFQM